MSDKRVLPLLNRLGGFYRDPNKVDRDVTQLLRSSVGKYLTPQISALVENDGTTTNTLVLQGTIAFDYRGHTYQQLVDIYLPPGFPTRPPRCFVRLAPNMYLKDNHRHVGSDGFVYMPYLTEWKAHSHTLVEMVVNMSSIFSADPPVFRRAAPAVATPAYNRASTTTTATTATLVSPSNARMSSNTLPAQQSAETMARLEREAAEANAAAEAARKAAKEEEEARKRQEEWDKKNRAGTKEKLRRKIYSHLQEESKTTKSELEQDTLEQNRLETASASLQSRMQFLRDQKKELQKQVTATEQAKEAIEEWLKEARTKSSDNQNKTIDELVVPSEPVHRQMMELAVKSHSITDALYFLDRALHKKTVDVPTHLKQVRRLAKQQFLAKAHLAKIQESIGAE